MLIYWLISSACFSFLFEDETGEIGSVMASVLLIIAIISISEIAAAEVRFLLIIYSSLLPLFPHICWRFLPRLEYFCAFLFADATLICMFLLWIEDNFAFSFNLFRNAYGLSWNELNLCDGM